MSKGRELSEEQARELWRRAAELQAVAEQGAAASAETHALPAAGEPTLSLEHVAEAARGAGIGAQFMHVALAEQQLPDAQDMRHDHWTSRWLARLMREAPVIERERAIAAEPRVVHDTLRDIAARPGWQLNFENRVGDDPLRDAVLVYRPTGSTDLTGAMFISDGRVLLITIRPHARGTTLRIRVPLFRRGLNLFLTGGVVSIFGGGAAGLSGAAAATLGAGAALIAAPAVLGAAAGGALGLGAFRGVYRMSRRRGVVAIDMLLQAIAMEAEGSADSA